MLLDLLVAHVTVGNDLQGDAVSVIYLISTPGLILVMILMTEILDQISLMFLDRLIVSRVQTEAINL